MRLARWRKAGPDHMVPRIILILTGVLMASAGVLGVWVLFAHGGNMQAVQADNMADELWGEHTPAYTVQVQGGNATVVSSGIVGMQVSLAANATQVLVGQPVTLTATTSEDVSGYAMSVYDETTGQWVGQTITSGNQTSVTLTQSTPGTHQYVVYIGPTGGAPLTSSSPVTVSWNAFQLNLQTPNANAFAGQSIPIAGQVTSNGTGVPNVTVSLSSSGGSLSPAQVTTDGNGRFTATFTAANPGAYTVTASYLGQTASTTIQVRPPFAVSLQANANGANVGQSVTLTATVNQDVSPDVLVILDQTTGQWVAGPASSGTTLSAQVAQSSPGAHTYVATIAQQTEMEVRNGTQYHELWNPLASSTPVTVTWYPPMSVTWNTSTWPPGLTISGYGFGGSPGMVVVNDLTQGWVAGANGCAVQPQFASWTNTQVQISGWTNYGVADLTHWSDGNGNWAFRPGDTLAIQVVNAQTGVTQTTTTTYPSNAPVPTVSLNGLGTLAPGQSATITGRVTFNGQPLANQGVSATANGGTLGGTAYGDNANVHGVSTDGNGNFSIPYTAPGQAGTVQITVSVDGGQASETVNIVNSIPTLINYGGLPNPNSFAGSYGTAGVGGNTASGGELLANGEYWYAQMRAIDVGHVVTGPLTVTVGGWPTTGPGVTVQTSLDGSNWTTIGYAPIPSYGNYTYSYGTQTFRFVRVLSQATTPAIDLLEIS